MISIGIFGPKLSGKSTLSRKLSEAYWNRNQIKTLVLDPNTDEWHKWGPHAWVTNEEEKFWAAVWKAQNCLVVVDEAATTIRREPDLIPVFTRLRHNHHRLIVIGHSGMDLLPVMRQQFDTLYLFRQPKSAAKVWMDVFAEERLIECTTLRQFEFIKCQLYGEPRKMKLKI